MAPAPVLELERLAIGYGAGREVRREVLDGLDGGLEAAELVCLLGPNGVGKSTLLRTMAGLQAPLAGRVLLRGRDLQAVPPLERARQIAVVLTEPVRVGLLRVEGLVALGRHPHTDWFGRLREEDRAWVDRALELVGAKELRHREVQELSDGERQKAMIARAVAQDAAVMLLDEPTAFLDVGRKVEVMAILRRLARDAGRSILLATHDLDLALQSADRLWILDADGRLVCGGPEDLVLAGVLDHLVHGEGARFDRETGSLRIDIPVRARVRLVGDGLAARWTRRALVREGLEVVAGRGGGEETEADGRVEVVGERWRSTWQGQETEHGSILELVRALRARAAPAAAPAAPLAADAPPGPGADRAVEGRG